MPGKPGVLKVAIAHQRRTALISLDVKIMPNQWDKKKLRVYNHPDRLQMNVYITIPNRQKEAVLYIAEDGIVSCSVNPKTTEVTELQFNLKDKAAKAQLSLWLKENVTDDTSLILNSSSIIVPYSDINQMMDTLNECGYNRFELHTDDGH